MLMSGTVLSGRGSGSCRGLRRSLGIDMVAAMDAVGVDGALLVSPYSMYGYDASYALWMCMRNSRGSSR